MCQGWSESLSLTAAMKFLGVKCVRAKRVMLTAAMMSLGVNCIRDRVSHDDCCDEVLGCYMCQG